MSETGEEREFQSDHIVDKKRVAKSIIWNWFGYFKYDKAQKMTVCVYMSSDGVYQDGKHKQPIEAPETVAHQQRCRGPGAAEPRKPFTSSSGAQTSIDCVSFAAISPYERRSKRSTDINNAVSYFIAKDMMPFWQKTYNGVK